MMHSSRRSHFHTKQPSVGQHGAAFFPQGDIFCPEAKFPFVCFPIEMTQFRLQNFAEQQ